jgi:hypothetical protein
MSKIINEGFWYSKYEPNLPKPVDSGDWAEKEQFILKLEKLQNTLSPVGYKGWSTCRICNCMNGSEEYSYKNFVWPSGYLHYIRDHNVHPSDKFKKLILG